MNCSPEEVRKIVQARLARLGPRCPVGALPGMHVRKERHNAAVNASDPVVGTCGWWSCTVVRGKRAPQAGARFRSSIGRSDLAVCGATKQTPAGSPRLWKSGSLYFPAKFH